MMHIYFILSFLCLNVKGYNHGVNLYVINERANSTFVSFFQGFHKVSTSHLTGIISYAQVPRPDGCAFISAWPGITPCLSVSSIVPMLTISRKQIFRRINDLNTHIEELSNNSSQKLSIRITFSYSSNTYLHISEVCKGSILSFQCIEDGGLPDSFGQIFQSRR